MTDPIRNVTTREPADPGAWPRWINLLTGGWLLLSVFLWPRTAAARIDGAVVGGLIAVIAVVAMFAPPARWLNVVLGLWLLVATIVLPSASASAIVNQVIVGLIVVTAAMVPNRPGVRVVARGALSPPGGR